MSGSERERGCVQRQSSQTVAHLCVDLSESVLGDQHLDQGLASVLKSGGVVLGAYTEMNHGLVLCDVMQQAASMTWCCIGVIIGLCCMTPSVLTSIRPYPGSTELH